MIFFIYLSLNQKTKYSKRNILELRGSNKYEMSYQYFSVLLPLFAFILYYKKYFFENFEEDMEHR